MMSDELPKRLERKKAMKKPDLMEMPVHDESPPINIGRADIAPKSGFILEIDGRMKNQFESESDAMAEAIQLKARFPMLQVKIYDAVQKTRAVVSTAVTGGDGEAPGGSA
jgi:hypothetical protein